MPLILSPVTEETKTSALWKVTARKIIKPHSECGLIIFLSEKKRIIQEVMKMNDIC